MENGNKVIYQSKEMEISSIEENKFGCITEQDKLLAAKQILCGLGFIYIFTVFAYLTHPENGNNLLEICKTTLPPLATLIIAFYFKDRAG